MLNYISIPLFLFGERRRTKDEERKTKDEGRKTKDLESIFLLCD